MSAFEPTQTSAIVDRIRNKLIDNEYKHFFSQFTKDQLKNFTFFEDIPGLGYRNAFRLQKTGDQNNLSSDSVHFKQLSKYNINNYEKITFQATMSNKKLNPKQRRRLLINNHKKKRYYIKMQKINSINQKATENNKQKPQNTLSNKMWLYLEKNKTSIDENVNDCRSESIDRTGDFMKYLSENKGDLAKWLEFVEYQTELAHKLKNLSRTGLYERKVGIFEKAIKENPNSFRLKIELVKLKATNIELTNVYNAFETIERQFYMLLGTESIRLSVNTVSFN